MSGKKQVLVLLTVLGLTVLTGLGIRGVTTLRWGMKECLQWYSHTLPTRFPLNDRESQAIQAHFLRFGTEIEAGNRSLFSGWALLRAMESGSLGAVIWLNGLQSVLIRDSVLSPADFTEFQTEAAGFLRALQSQKIASETISRVRKIILDEQVVWSRTPSGFIFPESSDLIRPRFLARDVVELTALLKSARPPAEGASETPDLSPSEAVLAYMQK